ncbi:SORL protein, partial [Polyodon spathula]|nr:SORL protein [Polyodon spathula]
MYTYVVHYRLVGQSAWNVLETHSNKSSYVLRVLKPDSSYQVKVMVKSINKIYNSNDVITLRTPEGIPDPPQKLQLTCDAEESTSIIVSWQPPVCTRGLVREYIVEYSVKDSNEWTSQRSPNTNHTEIRNLQLNELYSVRVAAVTSRGIGNWSESKSIMAKNCKALPCPRVYINSTTENSVTLSIKLDSKIQVEQYVVDVSWVFDAHVRENRTLTVEPQTISLSGMHPALIFK